MQVYEGNSIRFEYPDDWKLTQEDGDGQVTVTIEGPGTAYWMVSILQDRPAAETVLESVLSTFHEEYDELDVYESDEQICLLPTAARDVEIVSLDLIVKARLRVCEADTCSICVLYQIADAESDDVLAQLDSMSDSLAWDDGDNSPINVDPFEFDNLFGGQS